MPQRQTLRIDRQRLCKTLNIKKKNIGNGISLTVTYECERNPMRKSRIQPKYTFN